LTIHVRPFVIRALVCTALGASGCAFYSPYVGQGPHPQITRGTPVPPIDIIGNILSLPGKLILLNWRFNSYSFSPETEEQLVHYLDAKTLPAFEQTVYRLNQYAPFGDLRALIKNRHVAWPYRLSLGLLVTVLYDVLLPGRLFPWGDYFNPYTNVVHLYSDDITIALHEAGHSYDFADFPLKGTYATLRLLPFLDLYQEWQATENAIDYFIETQDRETELRAYTTLWPAYGTYMGAYVPVPIGSVIGAAAGHILGRVKARTKRAYYREMDAALHPEQH